MKLNPIAGAFTGLFILTISKTVKEEGQSKGKHVELAKHNVPVPLLADFGIEAEINATLDKETGKPALNSDGLPIYTDDSSDWLFLSIVEKVKASARTRCGEDGKLIDGKTFASTFEELTAESLRGNQALQDFRDAAKSFVGFLETAVKSAPGRKQLLGLFSDPKAIATAESKFRVAVERRMIEWFSALAESDQTRFSRKVAKVKEALDSAKEEVADTDL